MIKLLFLFLNTYHTCGNDVSSEQCSCWNLNTITLKNFDCRCIISVKNEGFIQQDNLIPFCKSCNNSFEFYNVYNYMILSGIDRKKIKQTIREFVIAILLIRCIIMNIGWFLFWMEYIGWLYIYWFEWRN